MSTHPAPTLPPKKLPTALELLQGKNRIHKEPVVLDGATDFTILTTQSLVYHCFEGKYRTIMASPFLPQQPGIVYDPNPSLMGICKERWYFWKDINVTPGDYPVSFAVPDSPFSKPPFNDGPLQRTMRVRAPDAPPLEYPIAFHDGMFLTPLEQLRRSNELKDDCLVLNQGAAEGFTIYTDQSLVFAFPESNGSRYCVTSTHLPPRDGVVHVVCANAYGQRAERWFAWKDLAHLQPGEYTIEIQFNENTRRPASAKPYTVVMHVRERR